MPKLVESVSGAAGPGSRERLSMARVSGISHHVSRRMGPSKSITKRSTVLLSSRTLPGVADVTRLVRLALVTASRDLPGAWKLLAQAAALQPKNPEIRSFRAQILEATGKIELARLEYVAALVAMPQNPLLRDQLADLYQRNHSYDLALDTWTEALARPNLDFIWLKAHFRNKVLRPVNFSTFGQPPAGGLEPLARQLAALKPGRFFETNSFDQLPRARSYTAQRQEAFWLRLLDALQSGREAEAFELLKFQTSNQRSWEPDLAAALFRGRRRRPPPRESRPTGNPGCCRI